MRNAGTTQKYLARYAEPTAEQVRRFILPPGQEYRSVVCVPAYDESFQGLVRVFSRVQSGQKRLVILVVNQPVDAPPSARLANEGLKQKIFAASKVERHPDAPLYLCKNWCPHQEDLDLLLVDATHPSLALGRREGVGRARKMALDAALALHQAGMIESPFLGSTDADVLLPANYFSQLELERRTYSALLFSYRHIAPAGTTVPPEMRAVETIFRYYVLGLASAGSPYAYHSLGSTLAVHASHYAQVRGVPNRMAGEDFYLLAKLGKIAPLLRVPETIVDIMTRHSLRVPFGTGPSFAAAEEHCREGAELPAYHPRVFAELSDFLELSERLASQPELSEACLSETSGSSFVLEQARRLFESLRGAYAQCPSARHRRLRLHERFDSLATLQLIHGLEANGLVRLPLSQALAQAPFLRGKASLEDLIANEESLPRLIGVQAHTETSS